MMWSLSGRARFFVLFLVLAVFPATVLGWSVNLRQTGQARCFDNLTSIPCNTAGWEGQDAFYQSGADEPTPRFMLKNGGNTVKDSLTGLQWTTDARHPSFNPGGVPQNWLSALSQVTAMNSAGVYGFQDWRLPNIEEFMSLNNAGVGSPGLWLVDPAVNLFTNVQQQKFWSSTSYITSPPGNAYWQSINSSANGVTDAYAFDTASGAIFSGDKSLAATNYVWAVRGGYGVAGPVGTPSPVIPVNMPKTGQTHTYSTGDDGNLTMGVIWPSPRFNYNQDGTVTDNLTGLIWLKDPDCSSLAGTWQQALNNVWQLHSGAGACGLSDGSVVNDWRLPNRDELLSLGDYENGFSTTPFVGVRDAYWSSTTWESQPSQAWTVTNDGLIFMTAKTTSQPVWPVRTAPRVVHWAQKAAMPNAMANRAAGVWSDQIFLLGGAVSNSQASDRVHVYRPILNNWTTAVSLKSGSNAAPRSSGAFIQYSSIAYVFGGKGQNNNSASALNTIQSYDMSNPGANGLAGGTLQTARFAARAAKSRPGHLAYVVGGIDSNGNPIDTIEEFDLQHPGNSARVVAQLPYPLKNSTVFVYKGQLYIYGGKTNDTSNQAAAFYQGVVLDLSSTLPTITPVASVGCQSTLGVCNQLNNLTGTAASSNLSLVPNSYNPDHGSGGLGLKQSNGKVYSAGGKDDSNTITNQTYEFDPILLTWNVVGSMPTARIGHTTVNYNDRIYVFGGRNASGYLTANEVGDVAFGLNSNNATIPTTGGFTSVSVPVGNSSVTVNMPNATGGEGVWITTMNTLPTGMDSGFQLLGGLSNGTNPFYDISTTADVSGGVDITLPYTCGMNPLPTILHYDTTAVGGPAWVSLIPPVVPNWTYTTSGGNCYVTAHANSLSIFALGQPLSGSGGTPVPVMEGWWLAPGVLAGLGFLYRRRKE